MPEFELRVRETVIKLYTVEGDNENDARAAFFAGNIIDEQEIDSMVDYEIESVKELD